MSTCKIEPALVLRCHNNQCQCGITPENQSTVRYTPAGKLQNDKPMSTKSAVRDMQYTNTIMSIHTHNTIPSYHHSTSGMRASAGGKKTCTPQHALQSHCPCVLTNSVFQNGTPCRTPMAAPARPARWDAPE